MHVKYNVLNTNFVQINVNNIILNKQEKKELVIKLLQENKTYRDIQEIAHVAPNFITKIRREEFGEKYIETESGKLKKKLSKRTQAIDLFIIFLQI